SGAPLTIGGASAVAHGSGAHGGTIRVVNYGDGSSNGGIVKSGLSGTGFHSLGDGGADDNNITLDASGSGGGTITFAESTDFETWSQTPGNSGNITLSGSSVNLTGGNLS